MAPGCEPAAVRSMMNALRPLALGQSLAGAGGGGFLYLLTRDGQQEEAVRQVLGSTPVSKRWYILWYKTLGFSDLIRTLVPTFLKFIEHDCIKLLHRVWEISLSTP